MVSGAHKKCLINQAGAHWIDLGSIDTELRKNRFGALQHNLAVRQPSPSPRLFETHKEHFPVSDS